MIILIHDTETGYLVDILPDYHRALLGNHKQASF